MTKATTIEEALAACEACVEYGKWRGLPIAITPTCKGCNGTGYACGVAPTEIETWLFAMFNATTALVQMNLDGADRVRVAAAAVRFSQALNSNRKFMVGVGLNLAELAALSGREEQS